MNRAEPHLEAPNAGLGRGHHLEYPREGLVVELQRGHFEHCQALSSSSTRQATNPKSIRELPGNACPNSFRNQRRKEYFPAGSEQQVLPDEDVLEAEAGGRAPPHLGGKLSPPYASK